MTVQMTSVVRTLSGAAVRNGPALSRLLATMAQRVPGFEMMAEVASGAVLVDGEPSRELTYVRRSVPPLGPGEVALPLATLAAPSVADGRPLLCEVVEAGYHRDGAAFLEDFARVLLAPLLELLRLGVALEAHGQNTLVVLRDARPVRLLYRDLGGVRISPVSLSRHGLEAPPLHGDLASDDPDELRTKLFAAVFVPVAEVVSVLGRYYQLQPQRLWDTVASTVDEPALRDRPTLPVKATTAMRLAADPRTDLWASLPNPMSS
jgi:siderophore synthetase component